MGTCLSDLPKDDFMDPYCLLQLADDTNVLAESLKSLRIKFSALFDYSSEKYQHINTKKTKYMHMSESPIMDPIILVWKKDRTSQGKRRVHISWV